MLMVYNLSLILRACKIVFAPSCLPIPMCTLRSQISEVLGLLYEFLTLSKVNNSKLFTC
jgi:hypothetical protein